MTYRSPSAARMELWRNQFLILAATVLPGVALLCGAQFLGAPVWFNEVVFFLTLISCAVAELFVTIRWHRDRWEERGDR